MSSPSSDHVSYIAEAPPVGITIEYFHALIVRFGSEDDIPLSEIDIMEYRRTSL